ncbi:DUF2591 family protein [Hydrogenophaga sp. 2FB]|uniref:DUF2591 family protein n=1 Tax=Hydrogenophaga sp. 2FB TaxID=2502187 RepID=UPI0010FA115F|nr:DUF2591 family protein [Hydrogenophaga sp. 2FB]
MNSIELPANELTGPALDWATAIALGWADVQITAYYDPDSLDEPFFRPAKVVDGIEVCGSGSRWRPSSDAAQGHFILSKLIELGYIIEKADLDLGVKIWRHQDDVLQVCHGPTLLIAAARALSSHCLGKNIAVPTITTSSESSAAALAPKAPRP